MALSTPDLAVVVLAGGSGTRFWPASTTKRPKQLLPLLSDRPMVVESAARVLDRLPKGHVYVVASERLAEPTQAALREGGLVDVSLIMEPEARDTAAAVVLGAARALTEHGEGVVVAVLTADHRIEPRDELWRSIQGAAVVAGRDDCVVTFGIAPTFPATGYGYLELGERIASDDGLEHFWVARFTEKPAPTIAASFAASGRHLWNSGMFVFRAAHLRDVVRRVLPSHSPVFEAVHRGAELGPTFAALPRVSIDKGVMEKTNRVRVVRAPFAWSDVGSFPAVAEHLAHDHANNAARGRVVAKDAGANVVWCDDPQELVALFGVDGLVVVRAGKRTLVTTKARAEDLKALTEQLSDDDR